MEMGDKGQEVGFTLLARSLPPNPRAGESSHHARLSAIWGRSGTTRVLGRSDVITAENSLLKKILIIKSMDRWNKTSVALRESSVHCDETETQERGKGDLTQILP